MIVICNFLFLLLISYSFLIFLLGYLAGFFGCDLISYGLVVFSSSMCVLLILAAEFVFRSGYFLFFLVIILLYCMYVLHTYLHTHTHTHTQRAICSHTYVHIHIQGVTGGTDQTSGGCSLC